MESNNPYASSAADLTKAPSANDWFELADRTTRLVAVILDGLIAGACIAPLGIGAAFMIGKTESLKSVGIGMAFIGLILLIALVIYNCMRISEHGQTIGKKLMKIKIMRTDGSPISLGRWFVHRQLVLGLVGVIPYVGWLVSLVDSCLIFRENRQCLHDQIADTVVVKA